MPLSGLILKFIRRHWRAYALAAVLLVVIAVVNVWIPRQVGHLVDALSQGQATQDAALAWSLLALVGAALLIYGLRIVWRIRLFGTSYQLGVELRTRLYERLAQQSPHFFQTHRTGDLMARATNDVDAVEMAAGEGLLAGFDGLLTLVLVLAMMSLGVDWRLGLVTLLPFPLMAWAFHRISERLHAHSQTALSTFSDLNDHVQESLSGVRSIRALGLQGHNAEEFAALARQAAQAAERAQRAEAEYEPAVEVALTSSLVLSLTFGSYWVWQGELTLGQLTSYSLYLTQLIWPMFAAGWVLSIWQRGTAAWSRVAEILDAPLGVDDKGTVAAVPAGALSFSGVSFRYPGARAAAIDAVDLRVEPGQTVGIVGPTGSGKSTLIKLLLRQWDADAGRIELGGTPLLDLQLAALYRHMAWVPQEPVLFSASVAENIALAHPEASPEAIEAVARMAAVHEGILRLPEGYATRVGERGTTLSGGQRQRVALARALLSDAPVLLLDDALSAVDSETEARILHALSETRQRRTVLVITHRLSALVDADQIWVLREGRVVEQGQHSELLTQGLAHSWYARQWQIQQLQSALGVASLQTKPAASPSAPSAQPKEPRP